MGIRCARSCSSISATLNCSCSGWRTSSHNDLQRWPNQALSSVKEPKRCLAAGNFMKPTVFVNVTNDMTIAQEEIFGPVLCVIPYETEKEAIRIANDTRYGLH